MKRLLIVNADDLGYDPAVNRGILEAMRGGLVGSATLMVNTPHAEEAANAAQGLAVGLHLNLARFAPVGSDFPDTLLANGHFSEARASELPPEVVEKEALAQLARLEALLGRPPTHLDSHKHLHRRPNILEGVAAAAWRRGLPVRAVDEAMRVFLRGRKIPTTDHFVGDAGAEAYWTLERLRQILEALPPSGTVELMCHPGYAPISLTSGYAAQREVELKTFTHPAARQLVERLGFKLGDFSMLVR
ncbi:MAG: carbohydrate deacetylase [Myxococcota bacterium]